MRLKARFQEWMISLLERRYSGIREVVGLLDKIRERVENQEIVGLQDFPEEKVKDEKEAKADENGTEKSSKEENGELKTGGDVHGSEQKKDSEETDGESIFKPDDGKWRPVLATLALIYKLQKVSDDSWYDKDEVFMKDKDKMVALLNRMAFFWHRFMKVASNISGEEEEELKANLAEGMELELEDVIYVYNKDAKKGDVEEHLPDIALTIDKERKELLLTVAGTKVFPMPSAADIIMDLYAESVPFHKGRAHRGMAAACENILEKVLHLIVDKMKELKDFTLLIVGYSLGAGVAQLLGIKLSEGEENKQLPEGSKILCVTFGAPPVYAADEVGYVNPSIISVYNHNDGLATLSLHTVTQLFLQLRATNRLCLGRRHTFRLLRSKLGQAVTEDGRRRYVARPPEERIEGWNNISAAMKAVKSSGFSRLTHCAGTTYLLKKSDLTWEGGEVGYVVRRFEGNQAEPLARELRLRAGMFNDHMPWGYQGLFKGLKGDDGGIGLTDLIKYL